MKPSLEDRIEIEDLYIRYIWALDNIAPWTGEVERAGSRA